MQINMFTDKHAPLGQYSLAFYWVLVETKAQTQDLNSPLDLSFP